MSGVFEIGMMSLFVGGAYIIKKVIKDPEYIGSEKKFFSEPSLFETKLIPTKQRPFDLAAQLAVKSVSPKAKFESTNSKNKNETKHAPN